MRYKKLSRKQRIQKSYRRALLGGLLVFFLTIGGGLLVWIAVGQPHRHRNHWHWDKDKRLPGTIGKDETKHE